MKPRFSRVIILFFVSTLFFNCHNHNTEKLNTSDTNKKSNILVGTGNDRGNNSRPVPMTPDTNVQFETQVYLKIDQILSGETYVDKNGADVFFRIIEIPEEENISLYAEQISIGDEGGNYKLIKRVRLTDDKSVLPKFGISAVDSLKIKDTTTISGYFNKNKLTINLLALKKE